MRIIAGAWRGRKLLAPSGEATRPTADRTREALFSMLQSRLGTFEGLAVADLFAGTGALGLEALSRGAASCLFVEQDRAALDILRRNIDHLGAGAQAEVRPGDARRAGARGPFHLVMLDPPYGTKTGATAIAQLVESGALAPGAIVSLETQRGDPPQVAGLELLTERSFGKALVTLFRMPNPV